VIQYQPAVPIVKATPVYPPELQTLAVTRKIIEVKVTIDTSGKVTRAEAIPQKNVSQFLVNSAVNAARLWRFQPARRNEEPVSSETLLQFAFGR
jgi:TonB family protein